MGWGGGFGRASIPMPMGFKLSASRGRRASDTLPGGTSAAKRSIAVP